jgi:hypothetical protein
MCVGIRQNVAGKRPVLGQQLIAGAIRVARGAHDVNHVCDAVGAALTNC